MNFYLNKINNLSDQEKKELGEQVVDHLEQVYQGQHKWNVLEGLPVYNDFHIDFTEKPTREEQKQIDQNVSVISTKLISEEIEHEAYKDDIKLFKAGSDKAQDTDSKLWYFIIHGTKFLALSNADQDKLEMSEEEAELIVGDRNKALESLAIKDKASAIAAVKKLAGIKTRINYEVGRECQRVQDVLQDEDFKEDKADYIVRHGASLPVLMKGVCFDLETAIKEKAIEALKKDVKISEDMTVDEFTTLMGYDLQEKIAYCNERSFKLTDKVIDLYKMEDDPLDEILKDYAERVYQKLDSDALEEAQNIIGDKGRALVERAEKITDPAYESEANLDDTEWSRFFGDKVIEKVKSTDAFNAFITLNKIVVNGVTLEDKGLIGPVGVFNEPVNPVENEKEASAADDEFDKIIEEERLEDEAKHLKYLKNWQKRFHPNPDNNEWGDRQFDNETLVYISNELRYYVANESKNKLVDMGLRLLPGEGQEDALSRAGIGAVPIAERSTQYMLWLIAEKGVDIKDALNQGSNEAYKKEFLDFVQKNPVGEFAENGQIEAWARVYDTAYKKIREYQLPDIDYSDPDIVAAHMDEIVLISAIGEYGSDLMERTFDGNGKTIASNEIGKDNFNEIGVFMRGLETLTRPIRNAYIHTPAIAHYMEDFDKQVKEVAVDRYLAGKRMEEHAGKKLFDVATHKHIKNGNNYLNYNDEIFKKKIADKKKYPEHDKISTGVSLDILMTKGGLKGRTDRLDAAYAANLKGFEEAGLYMNVLNFRKGLNGTSGITEIDGNAYGTLGNPQKKLADLSDDPKMMRAFLKKKNEGGKNVKQWLEQTMAPLIAGEFKEIFKKNALKISDLFVINGNTAEGTFGIKYADVNNPAEKEKLIQLEILKTIYQGEKKVEIKRFSLDENEKLAENGRVKIFADKHMAEKMIVGSLALDTGLSDIAEQLKGYKNKLLEALPPVENERRRDKENRLLTAGSTLYRNMAQALKNAIDKVEDRNQRPEEIRNALVRFQRAAKEYYNHRKGIFFGPITDMGKQRLAAAEDARQGLHGILLHFDNLRRGLNVDHTFGYQNTSVSDASYNEIQDEIKQLNDRFRETYSMKVKNRKQDGEAAAQNIKDVSEKQLKLLAILAVENPSHIVLDYKKVRINDMVKDERKQSILQYALNYQSKRYIQAMLLESNKPEDIDKLIKSAENGKFRQQVEQLMQDDTFIRIVKNHPKNYYAEMRKVEMRSSFPKQDKNRNPDIEEAEPQIRRPIPLPNPIRPKMRKK